MNKMFKISSIVAAVAVSGMLVGCGSSTKDSGVKKPVEPETPVVDVRQCTFTKTASVEVGKDFDATKMITVLDGNKKAVKAAFDGKVDTKKAGTYPVKVSSADCKNTQTVVVTVVEPVVVPSQPSTSIPMPD